LLHKSKPTAVGTADPEDTAFRSEFADLVLAEQVAR